MLFCYCGITYAQYTVSGRVTNAGEGLPGVNILVKGTSTGTVTDIDGRYTIRVNTGNETLVFSFTGYLIQEVQINNRSILDVAMEEDVKALEEVIVIGYGTQKKALNTGATLQVKGDNLQKLSTTNPLQALQGQAAGVQISSTSGQPGDGLRVNIRGLGTIGNSGPLYVVDGVITGDIRYLNNSDIESIDVLKDAASAAIYGSQAANGVILITTKQGKKGQAASISFDGFYGVQNVARKMPMLNSKEYATIMNEAAVNSGKLPYWTNDEIAQITTSTNWMDEMFVPNAVTQNYSLSAQGGSETSTYSTSIAYIGQEGIVGGRELSNYDRYNFRINSEHSLYKDIVKVGQNLTYAYVERNGIGVGNQYNNSLRGAFNTSPFVPMYGEDNNFYNNENGADPFGRMVNTGEANPYAQMYYNNQNRNSEQKLIGNMYMVFEPVKNLKYRTSLGVDYTASDSRSFTPIYRLSAYSFSDFTRVNQSMSKGRSLLFNNLLSYSFDVNDVHHFDVMVGNEVFDLRGASVWGSNRDVVIQNLRYAWLSNTTNTDGSPNMSIGGGPWDEDKRLSYFTRLNYNYKETYMINATFRADGSSRFAQGNRFGYFPSVSAGWVMSNEAFMANASHVVSSLKLRASWGQVGNQAIPAWRYMAPVAFAHTRYSFGPGEGAETHVPGAFPNRLPNPELRWETSEQANVGFDARFMKGKLDVNFDWYRKMTKDWLIQAPVLAIAGADAPFINGGDVINSGVELVLAYRDNIGAFNYSFTVNGAYNQNTVGNIPTLDGIIHGATNQLFDNSVQFYRAQSGFPIGYFWGFKTNGIFQTEEEVQSYRSGEGIVIQPNAQPGDVRYVDVNGDGVIDERDKTMLGSAIPKFTFGFNFSADYKGFDFTIQTNGVAGNSIVQSYRNHANPYANYTNAILGRWHGPGSSNTMPRVTDDARNWTQFSDLYIHDGSFLRVSNVTIGYDFSRLSSRKILNQTRLYASALNLYTFTRYNGMDPEIGYGTEGWAQGIDLGYYPRPRTFMLGANIKF